MENLLKTYPRMDTIWSAKQRWRNHRKVINKSFKIDLIWSPNAVKNHAKTQSESQWDKHVILKLRDSRGKASLLTRPGGARGPNISAPNPQAPRACLRASALCLSAIHHSVNHLWTHQLHRIICFVLEASSFFDNWCPLICIYIYILAYLFIYSHHSLVVGPLY